MDLWEMIKIDQLNITEQNRSLAALCTGQGGRDETEEGARAESYVRMN